MKAIKIILCLILFQSTGLLAQTTLYFETFNSGTPAFTLNASDIGSDPAGSGNRWVINATYNSIFGNTPTQPGGIVGGPTSTYMHIRSALTANATFLAPADGNKLTKMNAPVSTLGATGVTLSFWLLCNGDAIATDAYFGRTYYSIDGGNTWIQNPATYVQISNWTQVTVTDPVFDNQADLRFAFMWVQVSNNEFVAADPAFSIDDIKIEGFTSSNTITTNAPTPAGPYCAGASLSVPFTSTGTFNPGNVYTAQLSDASGSFATPVSIGTLNSTANSGSIAATIPGGTPTGAGYLIRVVSSSPSITGSSTAPFTVNAIVVPSVTVSANPGTSICTGSSVTFTASPVNGGTPGYQWQINGGNVSGATNSTFTTSTLSNGDVVTVVMTSTALCASPANATSAGIAMTVTTSVTPSVTIAANPGVSICSGDAVSFTASPVNGGTPTYQWQVNGIDVGGATNPIFTSTTLANNDVVTVIMTSTDPCASPATSTSNGLTITVNPSLIPSVTISANPSGPVCAGDVIAFSSTPVNGGGNPAYQWFVNGISQPGETNATYNTSALSNGDQVTLSMTSNEVCIVSNPAISTAITVSVSPIVVPGVSFTVSPSLPVCSGTQLTFTSVSTNEGSNPQYQWTLNGLPITGATSSTYISNALLDGNIINVTLVSNAACAQPQSVSANPLNISILPSVTPTASVSANPPGVVCPGTTISYTAGGTGLGSGPTYQWFVNGTAVSGQTSSVFTSNTIQNNDVITVEITSSEPCATPQVASSPSITQQVSGSITPSIAIANNGPFCLGDTVIITTVYSGGGGAPTFSWELNGTLVAGVVDSVFVLNGVNAGDSVLVTMTSSAGCVTTATVNSGYTSLQISSGLLPSALISASQDSLCDPNTPVTFSSVLQNQGSNPVLNWTYNGTSVGSGTSITINSFSNGDVIELELTSSENCALPSTVQSNTITMTILPALIPSVLISVDNDTICPGASVNYTATLTNAGANPLIEWFVNGTANATGVNPFAYSPASGDVITVNITASADVCASPSVVLSAGVTVVVLSGSVLTPQVSISSFVNATCQGDTSVMLASGVNGGSAPVYEWYVNGVLQATSGDTLSYIPAVGNNTVFVVMYSNLACAVPDSAVSTTLLEVISPASNPPTAIISIPGIICPNASYTLIATTSSTGSNAVLQWYVNGTLVQTGGLTFPGTPALAGSTVSLLVFPDNGCFPQPIGDSITITVTPFANPSVSLTVSDSILCVGEQVVLNATANGDGWPFVLSLFDGNTLITAFPNLTIASNTYLPVNGSSLSAVITSSAPCLSPAFVPASLVYTIDVVSGPAIDITPNPALVVKDSVSLTVSPSSATFTYAWTSAPGLGCSNCAVTNVLPESDQVYYVTVTDELSGCSSMDSVLVTVEEEQTIGLPMAFSPNGDTQNDVLFVRGSGIQIFLCEVYDRWGNLVFSTDDLSKGWDGTFDGKECASGPYVYYLTGSFKDNTAFSQKGNVTLLR